MATATATRWARRSPIWCILWSEQRLGDLALARTMAVQGLVLAHLVYC
jgi:hypothetical protein